MSNETNFPNNSNHPQSANIPVESLAPFTRFCCSLGMIPASYKASMTYEEQLMWLCNYLENTVIPTVNNNTDVTNEMQDLYNELHDYVEHYFDNLDVQQEINNKLDTMASDGSLISVVAPYLQPFIDEQNQTIQNAINNQNTTIQNAINSQNADILQLENFVYATTNINPLVASSTAGMTDTTRIYVNTTDGNWYYYNGTTWVSGGTYQSTVIGDNTVTPENTTFCNHEKSSNLLDLQNLTPNCYLNVSGGYTTSSGSSVSDYIPISVGDIIRFPLSTSTGIANQGGTYDIGKNSYVRLPQAELTVDDNNIVSYTATRDGFIRLNLTNSVIDTVMVVKNITYPETYESYFDYYLLSEEFLLNQVQQNQVKELAKIQDGTVTPENTTFCDLFKSSNILQLDNITPNCYLSINGSYTSFGATSVSDYIPISVGDVIRFPLTSDTGLSNQGGTYNTEKASYTRLPQAELTVDDNNIVSYTATRNGFIRLNLKNSALNTTMVVINTSYPETYEPYYVYYQLDEEFRLNQTQKNQVQELIDASPLTSPLQGKKIGGCGDSIMESRLTGDAENGGAWIKMLGDEFSMTVNNISNSGSTLAQYYNSGSLWKQKSIYWQLKEHQDSTQNYIVFDGGVNDFSKNNNLGVITSSYSSDASNFDLDTILGGLEAICSELVFNHQGCKYGFLFNHRIFPNTAERSNIGTYAYFKEQIIAVLNKWGIPYLDLQNLIPPLNFTSSLKSLYTCNNDGWHPNALGYRTYYLDKIAKWLETL